MKILVTGANGQLGKSLQALSGATAWDWLFTDVEELDITNRAAVRGMVAAEGVDVIVNCAGYTNVEGAEDHVDLAERLNAEAVGNLAAAMKERGGLLIHISTDYVFGGEPVSTPISETQKPSPTGAYALSKLHGEDALQASGCRYVLLRTAWLYSEYGKNFVKTMLQLTAEKPSLKVVFDQVGTPTYAGDLAAIIVRILERADQMNAELYNYTDEGVCSWYDFAKAIAAYAGHDGCSIHPCHSHEFPSKVRRPSYSVLDKSKIKSALGVEIPHWTDSLKVCLKALS